MTVTTLGDPYDAVTVAVTRIRSLDSPRKLRSETSLVLKTERATDGEEDSGGITVNTQFEDAENELGSERRSLTELVEI